MAITLYTNMSNEENGNVTIQGRDIPVKDIYIIKACGEKLYIIYKEKPQEKFICTKSDMDYLISQLPL